MIVAGRFLNPVSSQLPPPIRNFLQRRLFPRGDDLSGDRPQKSFAKGFKKPSAITLPSDICIDFPSINNGITRSAIRKFKRYCVSTRQLQRFAIRKQSLASIFLVRYVQGRLVLLRNQNSVRPHWQYMHARHILNVAML